MRRDYNFVRAVETMSAEGEANLRKAHEQLKEQDREAWNDATYGSPQPLGGPELVGIIVVCVALFAVIVFIQP